MVRQDEYIAVEAHFAGRLKKKFFRSNELANLHLVEPAFFLALLKEGRTKNPLTEAELMNYCRALLQDTFHVILRRYLKISENQFFTVCQDELATFCLALGFIKSGDLKVPAEATKVMVWLYHETKQQVSVLDNRETIKLTIGEKLPELDFVKFWQDNIIDNLAMRIKSELKPFVSQAVVHGSFATRDFLPAWSDLDVLFFLKDEVFVSSVQLLNFKKVIEKSSLLVYKIDPLAHHELMFFTELDRLHYPALIFPPALFAYARALSDNQGLELKIRGEFQERLVPVMKLVAFFRHKVVCDSVSSNDFDWKNDLSQIMLFPAFLLEAVGIEVYKKFSFSRAKSHFSDLDFSVIDDASVYRKEWYRVNFLRYCPNWLFFFLPVCLSRKLVSLHKRLFYNKTLAEAELVSRRDLYRRFLVLSEGALDLLLTRKNG